MQYEAVIGLEVHAQILTKSKIFCHCSTKFGEEPNSLTCPVCLGMPGVLPVLNREVVNLSMKTAIALNCTIARFCRFARKNYFYPDLPKGYQISQYDEPLGLNGYLEVEVNGKPKKIGITRVHMEEDAGKNIHENIPDGSYVDLNRTGVPLMEIVSEPDIRSPEEAKEYLAELKKILMYLEVCDCNMEEGSLRCDANVSLRPVGQKKFGTKTELKNMNSFRNLQKALEYEIIRQREVLEDGGIIVQETRLWDPKREATSSMRSKEEAHDYRYFPCPDLVPLEINDEWVERIRKTLPELPADKRKRFAEDYKIPSYDAQVLTSSRALADYYEECLRFYPDSKKVSNWIMGDLLRELKGDEERIEKCPVSPKHLAGMLKLLDDGVISGKIAKTVFEEMYKTGKEASEIVKEKGLVQVTDTSEIEKIVDKVIEENPKQAQDILNGKDKVMGFLVGQVMKESKGKANPQMVNEILKKKLQVKK
ncbi:MAG: aspartyl/glutamyl-tRNA amidotransferase subunit B [Candidatus Schekmanbacteria bacterium RIFCSPHIGHO2_02_FULL_38_11]|uniref:Aspartyl/glutamyl-tRNA(Asn/Gln) amidotransferase subunit B n=1 Tax=Candidatus Schekmanbacteria bacterium RIFCSPLOWO2_12_FULL_38_15 TaxID=1817883 RepID=A0A1F7SJS8_9BACT|nr:MAG: aspartyl/glutamyl-tRNA amidotransferase subunit B [Candidatus Schekmanbacteria bacterium GWA2_38_9]OGL51723.1 MAG: aspartyl/glutamyl-tRNA amidotransferase subunit B [Candidatus Schekmanbacteria bacterium RIFCSPLOWO2_02_FULL_38_14]OGL52390.1 MAG: aspartyl/glutamyl-tRNA amidotransferase subunit B [Candidatus Schekmanbacteria bacterium RIFCSPHIGHO2_02_FULL_38_11]OGL54046.1 MAG: aspartyl/glutamyl-tRNA amidotransferase subunit B [Candidatus Schekmanbacteria bacterium RIFCSPLOWO2_12_FULL_38_15